jgi:hypothetical protein
VRFYIHLTVQSTKQQPFLFYAGSVDTDPSFPLLLLCTGVKEDTLQGEHSLAAQPKRMSLEFEFDASMRSPKTTEGCIQG